MKESETRQPESCRCHFLDELIKRIKEDERGMPIIIDEIREYAERLLMVLIEVKKSDHYTYYLDKFRKLGFTFESLPENIDN